MPDAVLNPVSSLPAVTPELWCDVSQFLNMEADLLDSRQYEAWLELLHEDIQYRMPIARNVRRDQMDREYTAAGQTAWFDEGITTLRQRVAQLKTGIHWAEEPASRVSHLVANIRVTAVEAQDNGGEHVQVRSRFLIHQHRGQTETALFIGKREDTLCRTGKGPNFRLLRREIFLDQTVLTAKALTIFF